MQKDKSKIIPFFSLGITALPGEPLPLHIFEARYKALIKHCQGENPSGKPVPFGISLTRADSIEPIGCEVEVRSVLKSYDDGRSLLLAWGLRRYRLLEVISGGEFPTARVVSVDDIVEGVSPELQEQAIDLYARVAQQEGLAEEELPNTSELISYQLASQIQLEQAERQSLLNQASEKTRLDMLIEIFSFRLTAMKYSSYAVGQGYIQ